MYNAPLAHSLKKNIKKNVAPSAAKNAPLSENYSSNLPVLSALSAQSQKIGGRIEYGLQCGYCLGGAYFSLVTKNASWAQRSPGKLLCTIIIVNNKITPIGVYVMICR
jgi:hypothetical protein